MDFGSWTTEGRDPLRRRRLVIGYGVGFALFGAIALVISVTAAKVIQETEEDVLEVKLASQPEPEPEPEPEPPKPQPQAPRPAGPRVPKLTPPTEVPQDKPAETAAEAPAGGSGDPYADGREGGGGNAKPAVVEPVAPAPPPPPPKPRGPIRVTENVTPPQCSIPTPSYPSSAKAAGIEGTVIIKYVVSESGAISNVTVVRGPPELHDAAVSAFRGVRCKPASLDGAAVSVFRIARFPFRIRT
jgi:protein TonB